MPDLDRFSKPLAGERQIRIPQEDELADYKEQELERRIERMTGRPVEYLREEDESNGSR